MVDRSRRIHTHRDKLHLLCVSLIIVHCCSMCVIDLAAAVELYSNYLGSFVVEYLAFYP